MHKLRLLYLLCSVARGDQLAHVKCTVAIERTERVVYDRNAVRAASVHAYGIFKCRGAMLGLCASSSTLGKALARRRAQQRALQLVGRQPALPLLGARRDVRADAAVRRVRTSHLATMQSFL